MAKSSSNFVDNENFHRSLIFTEISLVPVLVKSLNSDKSRRIGVLSVRLRRCSAGHTVRKCTTTSQVHRAM